MDISLLSVTCALAKSKLFCEGVECRSDVRDIGSDDVGGKDDVNGVGGSNDEMRVRRYSTVK